jgi:outer membrane protein assembly factor BamB
MFFTLLGGATAMLALPPTDEEDTVRSLVDLGLMEKVWEYQNPGGEPIYSSPIGPVTVYAGSGGIANQAPAVMFTSWDWYVYALDVHTGALMQRQPFNLNIYGRVQVGDVNNDGYNEIFAPCHSGFIRSMNSDLTYRWEFYSVYDREANGAITGAGVDSFTDTTRNWPTNTFMRRTTAPFTVNAYVRFLSGANAFVPGTADPNTGIAPTDRHVAACSGNSITVSEPWAVQPGAGDSYIVLPRYTSDKIFMHAGQLVKLSSTDWRLFCTGFDNMVYCLNANTGALIWQYATLENIEPYPLVLYNDGTLRVYAVSIDGKTRCFDGNDGTLLWEADTGQCDAFINAVGEAGALDTDVYVSSRRGRVYRVNANFGTREAQSTETRAWDYGDIDSSALPFQLTGTTNEAGRRVVVGGDSGSVYCFDNNLNTMWAQPAAPTAINSSPVIHNVTGKNNELAVLLADMRGTVHCYDVATGKSIGKLYHKGGIEGYPYYGDIDGDGKIELITTTTDGIVTCWRFLKGAEYIHTSKPGNDRWKGHIAVPVSNNDPLAAFVVADHDFTGSLTADETGNTWAIEGTPTLTANGMEVSGDEGVTLSVPGLELPMGSSTFEVVVRIDSSHAEDSRRTIGQFGELGSGLSWVMQRLFGTHVFEMSSGSGGINAGGNRTIPTGYTHLCIQTESDGGVGQLAWLYVNGVRSINSFNLQPWHREVSFLRLGWATYSDNPDNSSNIVIRRFRYTRGALRYAIGGFTVPADMTY